MGVVPEIGRNDGVCPATYGSRDHMTVVGVRQNEVEFD